MIKEFTPQKDKKERGKTGYLEVPKAKRDLVLVAIQLIGQQPACAGSIVSPWWHHPLHHSAGELLL